MFFPSPHNSQHLLQQPPALKRYLLRWINRRKLAHLPQGFLFSSNRVAQPSSPLSHIRLSRNWIAEIKIVAGQGWPVSFNLFQKRLLFEIEAVDASHGGEGWISRKRRGTKRDKRRINRELIAVVRGDGYQGIVRGE